MTSLLLTYIVFGLLGFLIARRIKQKPGTLGWIVLATLVVLSQWFLPGTRVIAVLQFHMYANYVSQALFFGMLVGFLSKKGE